jgi:FkbM family methyltransferase
MSMPQARSPMRGPLGRRPHPDALVTASALKLAMAQIVTGDQAGRIIGALTRKRIRHQGLLFDTRSADFTPRVRAQMFWGAYEGAETRMIRRFLRGSKAVVELGSSLGVTSAHIAAVMAPGGHLTCVEANPRLLPGLRDRTQQRYPHVQVDVVHAAVTDRSGMAALKVAAHTVGSRLWPDPQPDEDEAAAAAVVQVPAVTLLEIVRGSGMTDFDLVCDIEGAEAAFLLHDPAVLRGCQQAVIELHDTTFRGRRVSVFDLMNASVAAGFRVIDRHGPVIALARP